MQFQGNLGILSIGRKILGKNPKVFLSFFLEVEGEDDQNRIQEPSLWRDGLFLILSKVTRFGRVGVLFDRKNFEANDFFQNVDTSELNYQKKDKRGEEAPRVNIYQTQVLKAMALEGLADSVEFRRLARKSIRRAKNANCDTIFFPEAVFGEVKTQEILQQIAGRQLKVVTLCDCFEKEIDLTKKQRIEIFYQNEDPVFLKKRAEALLKTKLKDESLIKIL